MKKLFLLLVLLLTVQCFGAIAVVSHPAGVQHTSAGTTCANGVAITGNVGDFVAITVTLPTTSSVTSVADNASTSNVYRPGPITSNGARVEIWYTFLSRTATTVTATHGNSRDACAVIEYSGVTGVNGTYGTNSGATTTPTITMTTKGASSWMLSSFSEVSTATITAGASCSPTASCTAEITAIVGTSTAPAIAEEDDGNVTSRGTATTNMITLGSSQTWAAAAIELYSEACLANLHTLGIGCK